MKEQEIIEKIQNLLLRKNFFELHKYSLELLESLEPKKVLELLKISSKGIRMQQDLNYLEDELQLVEDINFKQEETTQISQILATIK